MNNMGFFNPFSEGGSGGGGGGGTSNYNDLTNKPKINSVPLVGNKSLEDLGIVNPVVDSELSTISENPVQNKVVTEAINDKLDIDDAVGKNVTGTEYTIDGKTVVADKDAEIFNDYENNKAVGLYSHAEGYHTTASGVISHAEGNSTTASGYNSHAEGIDTKALGSPSHAEGYNTTASGNMSHAEGSGTTASEACSHAEGDSTKATGTMSHTEGYNTTASNSCSHAEGGSTVASGTSSHAEGSATTASGSVSHAEGSGTKATAAITHAEGDGTTASGPVSHAEGDRTTASGTSSHAEGSTTTASGNVSHAEGEGTIASSNYQHTQGKYNIEDTNNKYAFIIGNGTSNSNRSNAFAVDWNGKIYVNGDANGFDLSKSVGKNVEGTEYTIDGQTVVAGYGAEIFNGYGYNKAVGQFSHAEGINTQAVGFSSHAEGNGTVASGAMSHAEGTGTQAIGDYSHVEGSGAQATGTQSHAEGAGTTASGNSSHTEGTGTIAASTSQHAQGKYNIADANDKYAFIIGNGTNDNNRSNAFAVDWDGKIYVNNSENGIDLNQLINDEDIIGIPPLTVTLQKQQIVTQWEIQGNTEQDGTPTTSNPIPIYGVGDKTNNLCSELVDYVRINTYNGVEEYANDMKSTDFIPVDFVANQYYTPSFVVPAGTTNDTYISGYDINKNYLGRTTGGITSGQPMEFQGSVDTSAVKYVRICANIQTQDIMFNVGNIVLPYEPYGYKISIVVNENTIIPFYLDSPLYEGDSASFADNGSSFVTRTNGVIESYNGETIGNNYVSSTGELSTGAFIVYKLSHPVTTQTTLPGFQLRGGENTIDIDTDVTPINLYISWAETGSKVIRFAYISPNGDDTNDGLSISSPFATINHALELGRNRILLIGGKYEQIIDLSKATGRHIQIESVTRDSRPVFVDPDCVLVESATLENGIYHATIDVSITSGNAWIYQDNVSDLTTTILDNERMPLQRGKSERCEDTKIEKCSSDNLSDALDEIANASTNIYKWYLDGTTLYFSAPSAPSAQNPICYSPGNGLFSNGDRSISLTINGIKCKYISLNVENLCDVSLADCQASNIFGWGAIGYSNTLNAKFLRCEASRCYNNGNGDGFNADVTNSGEAFAKHYSATLIDCWSHDNCDDGYSNHRHAESTIIGGLFEYNGKSGITPSYGEHCSCYNVYSRHNYSGFMCAGETEYAEGGKYTQLICHSCIAELNDRGGYYAGFVVKDNGNRMILIDCKSIGNTNAYYIGQTANAKLIDCTATGQQTLLDGYPENATVETTAVGRNVAGTTYTINNQNVVAQVGAEIFNTGKFIDGGQELNNVNTATGLYSHAEGVMTTASGDISHAEGKSTTASGWASHAEGEDAVASGNWSHAKGYKTTASGNISYAEGSYTQATGTYSHAEGDATQATGVSSHAEGADTKAIGNNSHAEGKSTIAAAESQHVQGKYNIAQGDLNTQMAFIIGNGTSNQNRSNAFAIDWDGKIYQGNTNNGISLVAEQEKIDENRAALIGQVNNGAKNMINASDFVSSTKNGITLTKNADDSFTITGTFTSHVTSFFTIDNIVGVGGTVLAFDGGESGIYAYARNGNPTAWLTSSNGVPITTGVPIPDQDVGVQFDIAIMIDNSDGKFDGRTFDKTVRIMICTAADYAISPAFVPYAPTNRELTITDQEIMDILKPMTQAEYNALTTKTLPLYFVYEE